MASNKNNDIVTVRELYQLVDQKMDQVNKSINKLNDSFSALESGRLSSLEKNVANMQGKMMMIPILITLAFNLFFFFGNYILNKK